MKPVAFFSALALAHAAKSNVVDLTGKTFDKFLGKNDLVIAEFFAPWCGHCKALAPEYEKAADELKSHKIAVAKIDCTEDQELCASHGVAGYPTLKVFKNKQNVDVYSGARTADSIVKYMISRSLPAVTVVNDAKELAAFLAGKEVAVVAHVQGKSLNATVTDLAESLRDRVPFVASPDAKVVEKYGLIKEGLAVFRNGEEAVVYSGDLSDAEALTAWLATESFPTFGDIGPDNYAAYTQSGVPILFAFVETPEQKKEIRDYLTPHTAALKGKANIVFLNTTLFGGHAENVNLRPEFPALVVHDINTNKKYVHSQDIDLTATSVAEWAQGFADGTLEAHVKSEEVYETQDGPVYQMVGKEYEDIVLDETRDVLVEFYAPWCGHCKKLSPTYDELASLYASFDGEVRIVKVDHTLNEVPDAIQGYPTIKLYPANAKNAPVTFEGARTLEELAKFISENGSHHVNAAVPLSDGDLDLEDGHEEL